MFGRLLRRGPKVGDETTVLAGPFAGHSGRITDERADGRFQVTIDDCCQPIVEASGLRVVKSAGFDRADRARKTIERNVEVEITRGQADAADAGEISTWG